ncbi:MAG: thermonuclease family protein [Planctomycetota bacterium]|nr:thermonuclease family protein [Planctomycetota bacterium]
MTVGILSLSAFVMLTAAATAPARESPEIREISGEVVSIADGDTVTVLDADKVQHKIRLQGIDAPEKKQPFGTAARKALGDKIHRENVRIVWKEKDKYGRILGEIHLGDRHINREMVSDGYAWWYEKYAPKDRELGQAQAEARKERRGLWRDIEGGVKPEAPWDFRKRQKQKRKLSRNFNEPSQRKIFPQKFHSVFTCPQFSPIGILHPSTCRD